MLDVSQVSLPMRIALLATLAFSALWLVALRPKAPPESATPAPVPVQSAPGKAAEQARGAADASQASAAEKQAAADAAGTEAGTAKPTTPADTAPAKPGAIDIEAIGGKVDSKAVKAVIADIKAGKVVVLLFWDRNVSDDRAVRTAVASVSTRNGKVAKHVASLDALADYEPITRGVPVVTSPTVLIIDRARRARSVAGLTTHGELDELVSRALKVKP